MQPIKNIIGFPKTVLTTYIKIRVFFHFLPYLFKGKLSLRKFILFLHRLLYFLKKLKHNRFVRIGRNTRPNLYVPGFPSPAFFTACKKFLEFDDKIPCATALISLTSACIYNCEHCYQKHDIGKDSDIELLVSAVKKMQDMGVAFFNVEGGEPFMVYERLLKVCRALDNRSEIWINSTGYGITLEKLRQLKELNVTAIMFSLHSPKPVDMNSFMKSDTAWQTMEKAIALCHKAGIAVAFNTCLFREDFYNGKFEAVLEKMKEFGAAIVQVIKPKPAGGWLESGVDQFSTEDVQQVFEKVNMYNLNKKYRNYPSISAQIMEEDKDMFGCTAGGTDRFYLNAKGDVQPCEFVNVSFGNIHNEDFISIYNRMREHFKKPGNAMLCENCSADIRKLYQENKLKSLPLNEEMSKEIYEQWDRGGHTELYRKVEDELK